MPASIIAQQDLTIGEAAFVEAASPSTQYVVVFEDNGETGYFYACDRSRPEFIVNTLHVYNVEAVTDKHLPTQVSIVWSEDGMKAGLYLNKRAWAVADFEAKRGYCRTNFPPPSAEWAASHPDHEWDESALDLLR